MASSPLTTETIASDLPPEPAPSAVETVSPEQAEHRQAITIWLEHIRQTYVIPYHAAHVEAEVQLHADDAEPDTPDAWEE